MSDNRASGQTAAGHTPVAGAKRVLFAFLARTGRRLWRGEFAPFSRLLLRALCLLARRPRLGGAAGRKRAAGTESDARRALLSAYMDAPRRTAFVRNTPFIGSQRPLSGVRYGRRGDTERNGCGWIAAYNARLLLGESPHPADVLAEVERGALQGGRLGTDPFFLLRYFRALGYAARLASAEADAETLCRASDAFLYCYLWRSGERLGGHFAAGRADPEGGGYTVYNGGTAGAVSVSALPKIDGNGALLRLAIGLSRPGTAK